MKFLIVALLFISLSGYGQEFRKVNLMPDSIFVKTMVGKKATYAYQNYTFDCSGKIIKVRMNKKLSFADESAEDQKAIVPHLLISQDTSDLPILMIDHYSKILFGFTLYELNGLETVKLGFIPVAALDPESDITEDVIKSISIADKLLLETDGIQFRISFTADPIVIRPGSEKEEVIEGDLVKFFYNGKKLKEVEEF